MWFLYYLKFAFWYHVSHYHHLMADKYLFECYSIEDQNRFRKYGEKVLYHSKKFYEIQETLDGLKEKICKRFPELRD